MRRKSNVNCGLVIGGFVDLQIGEFWFCGFGDSWIEWNWLNLMKWFNSLNLNKIFPLPRRDGACPRPSSVKITIGILPPSNAYKIVRRDRVLPDFRGTRKIVVTPCRGVTVNWKLRSAAPGVTMISSCLRNQVTPGAAEKINTNCLKFCNNFQNILHLPPSNLPIQQISPIPPNPRISESTHIL